MKIFLNLLKIAIFILALWILTQNSGQYVDIQIFRTSFLNVNLLVVILVTLTVGAVIGAVFMALSVIQARAEIKDLRNKNQQLLRELENLRNVSIDDIPDEEMPQLDAPAAQPEPHTNT